jgi:tetratricopeptide (TPR) repeat protein
MRILTFFLAVLLSACASTPPPPSPPPQPAPLLADHLFGPPTERISTDDVLKASDAMRRYLANDIAGQIALKGAQAALVDALYRRSHLKLEYDTSTTKTAAEAFDARSGNCLSLVLMTAALARELDLSVTYQSASMDEAWSRNGNLLFASGHVNITLGRRTFDAGIVREANRWTIDFLPPEQLRAMRVREIEESTVLAMYANNRAAEALARGQLDDAYAWAREGMRKDPGFMNSYNTLGVVYLRHNDLAEAERAFAFILERDPKHTRALANIAETYQRLERPADAEAARVRLAAIESEPPFHYFNLGMDAARRSDWRAARDLFAREVARADYYHEFHFWLGLADWQLGDVARARKHLKLAMENSTSRGQHDLYAAKLAWLQAKTTPQPAKRNGS